MKFPGHFLLTEMLVDLFWGASDVGASFQVHAGQGAACVETLWTVRLADLMYFENVTLLRRLGIMPRPA